MDVTLSDWQKKELEKLWFIFGNGGQKHTQGNHKFIQSLLKGKDYRKFYSPTPECVEAVGKICGSPKQSFMEIVEQGYKDLGIELKTDTQLANDKQSQAISHCCENNLHFDCSGSVIDDTDGNFKHRGECFCKCHSPQKERQPLESAVADDFNSSAASKDGGFLERLG